MNSRHACATHALLHARLEPSVRIAPRDVPQRSTNQLTAVTHLLSHRYQLSGSMLGQDLRNAPSSDPIHSWPGAVSFFVSPSAIMRSVVVHQMLVLGCSGGASWPSGSPTSSPPCRQISARRVSVTLPAAGLRRCTRRLKQSLAHITAVKSCAFTTQMVASIFPCHCAKWRP